MMANKWIQKGKSLDLFVQQTAKKPPVEIILLQHREERLKSTATGWLAEDTLYNQSIRDIQSLTVPLEPRLRIQCWEWSGRNDTATIETQIKQLLASNSSVYLLWTGQNIDTANDDANSEASYLLILDGTWQQAQSMFRKIPSLWNLPRISLTDPAPSKYILRQDYTGWRERFSTNGNEGGGLLCTAEVMASLLDRRGDGIGADEIRNRLDVFQQNYPIIVSRRKKYK
jgi:DTW domain-containing protein YfiP